MKIGIDFDNTLVQYDELFYKIAIEKDLIPIDLERKKTSIRDYLNKNNKGTIFTELQGEVYGKRIIEANPTPGSISAVKRLVEQGYDIKIISHKTKFPYLGYKYNLHDAAMSWLDSNEYFLSSGINLKKENVFFNTSRDKKIKLIHKFKCDYFIDDLPDILQSLNDEIKKILYYPYFNNTYSEFLLLKDWQYLDLLVNQE